MKTTRDNLLENANAMEKTDHTISVLLGTLGLSIFGMLCLIIWLSSSITTSKALQSKCDSLEVSKKRLEDNLNMGSEIRKFNELNK